MDLNRIGSRAAANGLFLLSLVLLLRNILKLPSFGFTGLIFGSLLPAILFFAGLLTLKPDLRLNLDRANLQAKISYKVIIVSSLGLFFLCYPLNSFTFDLHIPLMMLIVFLSFAYLGMLYCQFSGKLDWAVYIFFLCFPLLNLMEYWFGISKEGFEEGFVLTPVIFFLLSLFLGLLVKIRRVEINLRGIQIAIFVCLAMFLLSGFISSLFSAAPNASFNEFVLKYIYPFLMFPVVFFAVDSKRTMRTLINVLIVFFTINILISFYVFQRFGAGFLTLLSIYNGSFAGGLSSVGIASLLVSLLPPVLFMLFSEQDGRAKWIYATLSLLFFLMLIATFSRSAFLSASLGFALLFVFKEIRKTLVSLIIVLAVIVSLSYPLLANSRYMTLLGGFQDYSSQAHFKLWVGAAEMIKDYPIFGIGAGMWSQYVAQYCEPLRINLEIGKGVFARGYHPDPHNFYLETYLETGVAGLAAWLSFIVLSVALSVKLIRSRPIQSGERSCLGVLFLMFILTQAARNMTTGILFVQGLYFYGFIFWGVYGLFFRAACLDETK